MGMSFILQVFGQKQEYWEGVGFQSVGLSLPVQNPTATHWVVIEFSLDKWLDGGSTTTKHCRPKSHIASMHG